MEAPSEGYIEKRDPVTIRDLFPTLTEEQLKEVQETLHGYLEVVWEIYEEVKRERPEFFDKLRHPS